MTDILIHNQESSVEINNTTDELVVQNNISNVSIDVNEHVIEINQSIDNVTISAPDSGVVIIGNVQGPPGPKGEQGSSEATAIAGFAIEVVTPSNGDLLGFNGTVWSNVNKVQLTDGGNF